MQMKQVNECTVELSAVIMQMSLLHVSCQLIFNHCERVPLNIIIISAVFKTPRINILL